MRLVNLPALLAVCIWGSVFPFAKVGLAEFPALAFTALRPLVAGVLLFAWLGLRGRSLGVERGDWPRLLAAGLAGMAVFQFFTFVGLKYTTTTHNVLLYATSPLLGAGLLWALGRRGARPGVQEVAGLALGFIGVALLVLGAGAGADGGEATLFGDGLSLIGALGWVGVTLLPGRLVGRYGPLHVSAWLAFVSGAVLLPPALGELAAVAAAPPSAVAWLALLYNAVAGMIVAMALWQLAAHRLGPTATLVYVYLEPLVAVALAVLFLGDRLGPLQAVGALALLAGVGLVQRS